MYRVPMWCLCLCRARSLCSSLTNLTSASPFLRPWAFRQSAAPPLWKEQNREQERERERKKIQSGEDDTQPMIPLGLLSKTEIGENPLGNIESFEKSCNILIRRLPRQTPGSDHRVVVNKFHLAAVDQAKPQVA